jgi:glycosyltransferase involved in cell wall biosynthesis
MKKKKVTVTVGIPAYNEEANILNAIDSILAQRRDNFVLDKIIVISDASDDTTNLLVRKKMKTDKRIYFIHGKTRIGKAGRLNQIFENTKSELLLLLDADCLAGKDSITYMVKTFKNAKDNLGVIGARAEVSNVNSLFTKIIYSGVRIAFDLSKSIGYEKSVLSYKGALMGLPRNLYSSLKIPSTVGTDAYIFFFSLFNGYKPAYSSRAKGYYRIPTDVSGHIKQSTRFLNSQKAMKELFGDRVEPFYRIRKSLLMAAIVKEFVHRPFYLSLYVFLNSYILLRSKLLKHTSGGVWDIAKSTKLSLSKEIH